MPVEKVALRGSERQPMPHSQIIGSPDPNSLITVTVFLRRWNSDLPDPGSATLGR
jgi:hypothetical protein